MTVIEQLFGLATEYDFAFFSHCLVKIDMIPSSFYIPGKFT